MRSDYVLRDSFCHLLAALMPQNQLVLEVSLATGLRLSDVLNLRTDRLSRRMTITELKTGKKRRVSFPVELYDRLVANAGKIFVFEHRLDYRKHRTRQAVYKDIKRAAHLFRMPGNLQISPHSARKIYAVEEYHRTGSIKRVQQLLNHSDEAVTMLYAMADELVRRKMPKKGPNLP